MAKKPRSPATARPVAAPENAAETPSLHRSGAVARMLRMPVATLRVWERRYALTQPTLTPSGQRLYSVDDVRRLALIKQLTELGHAIGSLAALDMAQLLQVSSTHAHAQAATQPLPHMTTSAPVPATATVWRLAVVGTALATRLQRAALLRRIGRPVVLLGPFDDMAHAAGALAPADVDAVVIRAPRLHPGWSRAVAADAPQLAGVPLAVLYGFATDTVCEDLAAAGTALLREPQPDAVVAQWLRGVSMTGGRSLLSADASSSPAAAAVPPRRWDDAALADFAGRSSTVACECPRHVAELLVQLSHFEAYSAECAYRSAADAALHAYLWQLAAGARSRFEAALEHVALHEGLLLPAPPASARDAAEPTGRSAPLMGEKRTNRSSPPSPSPPSPHAPHSASSPPRGRRGKASV